MNQRRRSRDTAALVFGAMLLVAGGYAVMRNTLGFELGGLDGERIWPVAVVAIGLMIVIRAIDRSSSEHRP
jgi:hypothetical protein